MSSVFDLTKLEGLLKDFYAMSRIRITVFDENLTELVAYPEHVKPCCAVIRSTHAGYEACMASDREACRAAAKKHGPHIYRCHAGLTEAVTPLYVGDVLVGYLLFGHIFSYSSYEEGWAVIKKRCEAYRVDREKLKAAIFASEIVEKSYIHSASRILHAVASYLIMEHMASLNEDLLAVRLDSYLTAHFAEKQNAAMIADRLGIGKTRLYELSRQLYGCGIADRIRSLRMEKAKKLLSENKNLPLAEAAGLCGFQDYNYFITVFSREVGLSPAAWKRAHT